jgi:hypothetical protein
VACLIKEDDQVHTLNVQLNVEELTKALSVSAVTRLKRRGATHKEATSLCDEIASIIYDRCSEHMQRCTNALASAWKSGCTDESLLIKRAHWEYWLIGAEIADAIYETKISHNRN